MNFIESVQTLRIHSSPTASGPAVNEYIWIDNRQAGREIEIEVSIGIMHQGYFSLKQRALVKTTISRMQS